jgi:hypothetical protein
VRSFYGQDVAADANMGPAYTGLAGTVGYQILNKDGTVFQARTVTGVYEQPVSSGCYGVLLAAGVFSAAFAGRLVWDSGGATPKYWTEDVQMVAAPPSAADYTTARAARLDNLDATVSSRFPTAGYTAPDNANIAATKADTTGIKAKTDANLDATVSSRLAASAYTPADNAGITQIEQTTAAIKANTDKLGMGVVSAQSPVTDTGDVAIVAGDDYLNADGRALTFTAANWPVLTGATITLNADNALTKTGTVVNATTARVELTAADTANLRPSVYVFGLVAKLADGSTVTLVQARLAVTARPQAPLLALPGGLEAAEDA